MNPTDDVPHNSHYMNMIYKLVADLFETNIKLLFDQNLLSRNVDFANKTIRDITSEIGFSLETNQDLNRDLILKQIEQIQFNPNDFCRFKLANFPIITGKFLNCQHLFVNDYFISIIILICVIISQI